MRPLVSGGSASDGAGHAQHENDGVKRERGARGEGGAERSRTRRSASGRSGGGNGTGSGGLRVRHLQRGADDGFHSGLVQGLKSSEDAERLAAEIAFSVARLRALREAPFGLWAEVAGDGDIEERTWLAFQIAYIGPSEEEQPFATIEAARISWPEFLAGDAPVVDGVAAGARGSFDPSRMGATLDAYRAWVQRAGSQQAALIGETVWTAERRFERGYERLAALAGIERDMCFEFLGGLGATGAYPIVVSKLVLNGENEAAWAAKRAFGIGDPMLLERRAAKLAESAEVELAALDLALQSWGSGQRLGVGFDPDAEVDADALEHVRDAFEL